MPIFSLEKTTDAILEKFSRPSDYGIRRIVFWYDRDTTAGEKDLEYITEALRQKKIKLHILKNNFYETKKLLEHDDLKSDFLIYSPQAERPYKENWLLDIQLYSGRFENSRISDLKTEIGIEGYRHDSFLEEQKKFFANKRRVAAFKKFYRNTWNEEDFISGIFAVLTGSNVIDENENIRTLLMNSLNEDENTVWQEILRYNLSDKFWERTGRHYGYYSEHPTLKKLFLSFLITHIDLNTELPLKTLKNYINHNRQSNECEIFISGWMNNSKDSWRFDEYCTNLLREDNSRLEAALTSELKKSKTESYISAESPDIIDKTIIRNIVGTITEGGRDYSRYLSWIEERKTKHYYQKFHDIYSALKYGIMLLSLSEETEKKGIHQENLNGLFTEYRKNYYLHDLYYRKFYLHYDRDSDKEILRNGIREIIEREYRRINEKILMKWSDLTESEMNGKWGIELIDNQSDFFTDHVSKIISRNERDKAAVIISDALRYEVAAELKEVLNTSTNGTIEMSAMAGCLPSYTKLGMASLLPHSNLEYRDELIFADGINTDGLSNREKILLAEERESIAFSFRDLWKLKTDEAREQLRGKRIIYIYHNSIDETGDKHSSQDDVFTAAESAINDIDAMVNRLSRNLNINNIIITADHGFIYSRDSLESADIVNTDTFDRDKWITSNKRFIISSEKTDLPNTHRFSLTINSGHEKPLYIYTPYADLRFRLSGGGRNFVHGGAALQEIVIPVLLYNHNKSLSDLDRKGIEYGTVGITVIEQNRKITGNPFRIRLFQTENVTDKREPLTCRIGLYDNSGNRVSDEKTVIADKSSDEPNERISEVILTMSSSTENGIYHLKAFKEDKNELYGDVFDIPVEVDLLITDDF
ncbi:BREX-1 system phosphatase PglZ type A [Methanoplanus limicola]|uniref:Uncharacterized protein n=1 Tax=Methanoplanus limicola DSM 2279 TaxID=937775 RepID=H1Z3P1_9EURY|nr:BREX-1 system phosphatase PglZ type A [Methanoplanus limicola]EHQ35640.1 Conserved hypothetical protein CHP02687 [Methanoplanus limicola DSM 2279]